MGLGWEALDLIRTVRFHRSLGSVRTCRLVGSLGKLRPLRALERGVSKWVWEILVEIDHGGAWRRKEKRRGVKRV